MSSNNVKLCSNDLSDGKGVIVLTTEHAGPHLDEFGLVEVSVMVGVEHLDEIERHGAVEAHQLLQQRTHLLLAQHSVTVFIQ